MPIFRSESIVLRTYSLSEADKIVVLFTREHGVVRGVAKGAKRLKSKFGSSLEPFSIVNVEYFQKENSELASLQGAEIVESHFLAAASPEFLATFSHIADLLFIFSPPHDPNEKLYRMVKACLAAGLSSPADLLAVRVYFELWLLRLGGFLPDWSICRECGRELPLSDAAFLSGGWHLECSRCLSRSEGRLADPVVREVFFRIQKLSPAEFAASSSEMADALNELSEILGRIITSVLGRERSPAMKL